MIQAVISVHYMTVLCMQNRISLELIHPCYSLGFVLTRPTKIVRIIPVVLWFLVLCYGLYFGPFRVRFLADWLSGNLVLLLSSPRTDSFLRPQVVSYSSLVLYICVGSGGNNPRSVLWFSVPKALVDCSMSFSSVLRSFEPLPLIVRIVFLVSIPPPSHHRHSQPATKYFGFGAYQF